MINETHEMLKDINGSIINYSGLIEGFQIFENAVDVVVCDGFVGNIVLKACESLSKLISTFLDEELRRNAFTKTGALLSKGAFRSLKQRELILNSSVVLSSWTYSKCDQSTWVIQS